MMFLNEDQINNHLILIILEEFKALKLVGLTMRHDLSLANHNSKLVSKASHQLGILCCTKSFRDTPELLFTYKAFVCGFTEYCSPLWDGSPALHLAQLDAVETKAFKIIGTSHAEPEPVAFHFPIEDRSVVSLSSVASFLVFHPLLFPC